MKYLSHPRTLPGGARIPGILLSDVLADIAAGMSDRELASVLYRADSDEAHAACVRAALAAGHTHYPPDLAEHRCPLVER